MGLTLTLPAIWAIALLGREACTNAMQWIGHRSIDDAWREAPSEYRKWVFGAGYGDGGGGGSGCGGGCGYGGVAGCGYGGGDSTTDGYGYGDGGGYGYGSGGGGVGGCGGGYGDGGYGDGGYGPLDPRTTLTHDGVTYTAETVQRIVEGLRW